MSPKRTFLMSLAVAGVLAPLPRVAAQSCGIRGVFDLCALMGLEPDGETRDAVLREHPGSSCSMAEVAGVAGALGVPLVGVAATLDELRALRGPKVIHLRATADEDAHFMVVSAVDEGSVQFWVNGRLGVTPLPVVAARYSGRALILRQPATPGACVRVDVHHHELGAGEAGQPVSHCFRLANTGDRPLALRWLRACGSPEVTLDSALVAPGGATGVTASFVPQRPGEVLRTVVLLTNDLLSPTVHLSLHGTVSPGVNVTPPRVVLVARPGEPAARTVSLTAPADTRVLAVATTIPGVSAQATRAQGNGEQTGAWAIRLWTPEPPVTGATGSLRIETSHTGTSLIEVPVELRVVPNVLADPPQAFFGFVRVDQVVELQLRLSHRMSRPFTVLGSESSDPRIVAAAEQGAGLCLITIRLQAHEPGVLRGAVRVKTDCPGEPPLDLPVYAHVLAP